MKSLVTWEPTWSKWIQTKMWNNTYLLTVPKDLPMCLLLQKLYKVKGVLCTWGWEAEIRPHKHPYTVSDSSMSSLSGKAEIRTGKICLTSPPHPTPGNLGTWWQSLILEKKTLNPKHCLSETSGFHLRGFQDQEKHHHPLMKWETESQRN